MAPPKKKIEEARVFSRPTGTGTERNVELTGLSKQKKEEVSRASSQEGLIRQQLAQQAQKLAITERVLTEEGMKQPPTEEIPTIENIQQQIPTKAEELTFEGEPAVAGKLRQLVPNPLTFAAKTGDLIRTAFTGRRSLTTTKAQDTLGIAVDNIKNNIEAVKTNPALASQVRLDFEQAVVALNELESSQKELTSKNLNYWIDEGADVQAEIILQRNELENLRLELMAAQQEARLNQARLTFGQPQQ